MKTLFLILLYIITITNYINVFYIKKFNFINVIIELILII